MTTKTIDVGKDFSYFPGGRFLSDGEYSGEEFRENILVPALKDKNIDKVILIMDTAAGYGSSFLEEAFGGIIRKHGKELDLKKLEEKMSIKSELDYDIAIWGYIKDAAGKK